MTIQSYQWMKKTKHKTFFFLNKIPLSDFDSVCHKELHKKITLKLNHYFVKKKVYILYITQ